MIARAGTSCTCFGVELEINAHALAAPFSSHERSSLYSMKVLCQLLSVWLRKLLSAKVHCFNVQLHQSILVQDPMNGHNLTRLNNFLSLSHPPQQKCLKQGRTQGLSAWGIEPRHMTLLLVVPDSLAPMGEGNISGIQQIAADRLGSAAILGCKQQGTTKQAIPIMLIIYGVVGLTHPLESWACRGSRRAAGPAGGALWPSRRVPPAAAARQKCIPGTTCRSRWCIRLVT